MVTCDVRGHSVAQLAAAVSHRPPAAAEYLHILSAFKPLSDTNM